MKKHFALLASLTIVFNGFCQPTTKSFMYDSINREYIEYVPAIYNDSTPVPLVICLHGLGDNMNNFTGIEMHAVADTANFIVVTPQAIVDNIITGSTAWNSGASSYGFEINENIDDVGFLSALIDTVSANYNIDTGRVYVTGFSLGGFMSNRLACELNAKITAIASVAGTIGTALNCNPGRAVPVCHFHGTLDQQVQYTGNPFGIDTENLINYWVTNNNCDTIPVHTPLPDLVADGYTIDHFLYQNGDNSTEVEFYKVTGADHEWLWYPNNDISYTTEIWKFFLKHQPTPIILTNDLTKRTTINIYPNPNSGTFYIEAGNISSSKSKIEVYDLYSRMIFEKNIQSNMSMIDLYIDIPKGVYILKLLQSGKYIVAKLIIN
ncbi:MAG: T9SS type A sorting domain-containing protein [Bacteroidota bacterium]